MNDFMIESGLGNGKRQRPQAGLPAGESLREEALRQARCRRLEDRRYVAEPLRHWWLDEQGWLFGKAAAHEPDGASLTDRFLSLVGKLLISCGVRLAARSRPSAGVGL